MSSFTLVDAIALLNGDDTAEAASGERCEWPGSSQVNPLLNAEFSLQNTEAVKPPGNHD